MPLLSAIVNIPISKLPWKQQLKYTKIKEKMRSRRHTTVTPTNSGENILQQKFQNRQDRAPVDAPSWPAPSDR